MVPSRRHADPRAVILVSIRRRAQEVLASALHPLDRPSEPPRHRRHHDLLRAHVALDAEAAAHLGHEHRIRLGQPERARRWRCAPRRAPASTTRRAGRPSPCPRRPGRRASRWACPPRADSAGAPRRSRGRRRSLGPTSPVPERLTYGTLSGQSSWTRGADGAIAAAGVAATGSGSYATMTRSRASASRYGSSATTTATASPRARTRPPARGGWRWGRPRGSGTSGGTEACASSGKSSSVHTAIITPSRPEAAARSTPSTRAWACGLRTRPRYRRSGSFRSSRYRPRPATRRPSSLRLSDAPNCTG